MKPTTPWLAGVHGILLCNAESPEAARLMIEAGRYPFAPHVDGLAQGTRGNGSQAYASTIWRVPAGDYMRIADPWPMNPDGELLLDHGAMICTGGDTPAADKGRAFTKRTDPW